MGNSDIFIAFFYTPPLVIIISSIAETVLAVYKAL